MGHSGFGLWEEPRVPDRSPVWGEMQTPHRKESNHVLLTVLPPPTVTRCPKPLLAIHINPGTILSLLNLYKIQKTLIDSLRQNLVSLGIYNVPLCRKTLLLGTEVARTEKQSITLHYLSTTQEDKQSVKQSSLCSTSQFQLQSQFSEKVPKESSRVVTVETKVTDNYRTS